MSREFSQKAVDVTREFITAEALAPEQILDSLAAIVEAGGDEYDLALPGAALMARTRGRRVPMTEVVALAVKARRRHDQKYKPLLDLLKSKLLASGTRVHFDAGTVAACAWLRAAHALGETEISTDALDMAHDMALWR